MKNSRNLWPLSIVIALGLFAAGMLALIVIASSQKVDLVSADYYEQEIQFQRQLDRLNRTAPFGNDVKVAYDATTRRITILLPAEHVSPDTAGRIHLYRPSTTGMDRELALELDAAGGQSVDAAALLPGLWKVRVQWTARNQEYFADRSVLVGGAGT